LAGYKCSNALKALKVRLHGFVNVIVVLSKAFGVNIYATEMQFLVDVITKKPYESMVDEAKKVTLGTQHTYLLFQ